MQLGRHIAHGVAPTPFMMHSAARTLVEAGVAGSSMTLSRVLVTADVACCNRAMA
jgi:hypothetical protein